MGSPCHPAPSRHIKYPFAFGIFCMLSAAGRSGKGSVAVMLTAVVAAVIKLADFLLPGVEGGVLHPAMYILLEGAMMAIFCQAFSFRPRFKANPAVALWESRLAVPHSLWLWP